MRIYIAFVCFLFVVPFFVGENFKQLVYANSTNEPTKRFNDPSAKRGDKDTLPSALELLQASDQARGSLSGQDGVSWIAQVDTTESGEKSSAIYSVKIRGNDAIAEVTAPPRQKGEKILFNDRTLWFYKPGIKKPVSISARQRLTGQAANGDIASTQYARDYEGTLVGEDKVNEQNAYKLNLKAKAKNVTYDQINYWISKKDRLGVKAEFLTLSGTVFKVAEFDYKNLIKVGGKNVPFVSQMRISDPNNPKNVTEITYKDPHLDRNPIGLFNVNNLLQ